LAAANNAQRKLNAAGANAAAQKAALNLTYRAALAEAEAKAAEANARAAAAATSANGLKANLAAVNVNIAPPKLKFKNIATGVTRLQGILGAMKNNKFYNANNKFNNNTHSVNSSGNINTPWNKIIAKAGLNNNAQLKNRTPLGLNQLLRNYRLNASDKAFVQAEINRRKAAENLEATKKSFDAEYQQFMKVKNWAKFNSLVIIKGRMEKALATIGNNNGGRRAKYNAIAPEVNKVANRIAKVKALKSAGELKPYPDLVVAYNKGNYRGWNSNSVKRFNDQYNRFFNSNGSLKTFQAPANFTQVVRTPVTWRNQRNSSIGGKGKVFGKMNPSGQGMQHFIQKNGTPNRYYPITNVINNYGKPIYRVSRLTYGTQGAPPGATRILRV
jgi:hypothetical protein